MTRHTTVRRQVDKASSWIVWVARAAGDARRGGDGNDVLGIVVFSLIFSGGFQFEKLVPRHPD